MLKNKAFIIALIAIVVLSISFVAWNKYKNKKFQKKADTLPEETLEIRVTKEN